MNPKQLRHPFSFAERRLLLEDHVFYLPPYYPPNPSFQLDLTHYFGNERPCCIEYGSGNGAWIIERAHQEPEKNWLALEKRFDRVQKIWSKLKNGQLTNLLIICGEALECTRSYLPVSSLSSAYINFPDPWPKSRHAKHRLIQAPFLDALARVLAPNAETTLVTDDKAYLEQILATFSHHSAFLPRWAAPHFVVDWPNYGVSWFETLWRDKGRSIRYTVFIRKAEENPICYS